MKTVLISGADRNIGLELARKFCQLGWTVYAGRYLTDTMHLDALQALYPQQLRIVPLDVASSDSVAIAVAEVAKGAEQLDMLIHNAAHFGSSGGEIKSEFSFEGFITSVDVNAFGAMRLVQGFLPLMQQGLKRLCFVSSEAGVVSVSHRTAISGYGMSKTALNMALRLIFNQLQPLGYSFRLYHPGWVRSPKLPGQRPLMGKFEPWETAEAAVQQFIEDREWEDRLVLIDNEGAAWPF